MSSQLDPDYGKQFERQTVTGWAGWVAFAAVMMMMLGALHIVNGLVAIFNDEFYAVTRGGLVIDVDYTVWGWTHLIGGAIIMAAAFSLWAGRTWARFLAVFLAMISLLVSFGFLAAEPGWALVMITISILVIWALMVHGDELKGL